MNLGLLKNRRLLLNTRRTSWCNAARIPVKEMLLTPNALRPHCLSGDCFGDGALVSGFCPTNGLFLGLASAVWLHWNLFRFGSAVLRFRTLVAWNTYWFRSGFSHHILLMSEYFYHTGFPTIWECGRVFKIGRLWLSSGGRHDPSPGVGRRPGLAFCGTGAEWNRHNHRCGLRGWGWCVGHLSHGKGLYGPLLQTLFAQNQVMGQKPAFLSISRETL